MTRDHGTIAGERRLKCLRAVALRCTRGWNICFIRKAVPASKVFRRNRRVKHNSIRMIVFGYTEICFVKIIACTISQRLTFGELVCVLLPNSSSGSPLEAAGRFSNDSTATLRLAKQTCGLRVFCLYRVFPLHGRKTALPAKSTGC